MKVIGHIHTDFPDKFGIPRQSGLVPTLQGRIIFTPEFRTPEAVRGLEQFSHIWLLWQFSENEKENWSATVRPPRLSGNTRVGVFATRSNASPMRKILVLFSGWLGWIYWTARLFMILNLIFPIRTAILRRQKDIPRRRKYMGCE